jgi:hypothetical protein
MELTVERESRTVRRISSKIVERSETRRRYRVRSKAMNLAVSPPSPGAAERRTNGTGVEELQRTAISRRALRALSVPVSVVGLEWAVSATNKIIGNFVGLFATYTATLQAQHVSLPGLSLAVHYPILAARLVIATESALGIVLLACALVFLRGANRIWEVIAGTALSVSAVVAVALWMIVGSPPFWPNGNGFGSGWPVEFFLVAISAALAIATAIADPDGTLVVRLARRVRRAR